VYEVEPVSNIGVIKFDPIMLVNWIVYLFFNNS